MGYIKKEPALVSVISEPPEHSKGSPTTPSIISPYTDKTEKLGGKASLPGSALQENDSTKASDTEKPSIPGAQGSTDGAWGGVADSTRHYTTPRPASTYEPQSDSIKVVYAIVAGLLVIMVLFALKHAWNH
jgi:hypothetical protein